MVRRVELDHAGGAGNRNFECETMKIRGMTAIGWVVSGVLGSTLCVRAAVSAEISDAIAALHRVGPTGQGNAEAKASWRTLSTSAVSTLPSLLDALEGANELSANWLRSAADAVFSRALDAKQAVPTAELGALLMDTSRSPRARGLAFELLQRAQPEVAETLVPGFLNDPAPELRREAVARCITRAVQAKTASNPALATLVYQQALAAARDADQIEQASKALRELGQVVDLSRVFGFLTDWKVVGPFDSTKGVGFVHVYPPEQGIDLAAEYEGKEKKASWKDFKAADEMGTVDMNKVFGTQKGVAAYAYSEFRSDSARPVELRLACQNAWKVWVNGQYVFGRDEYHRGWEIDQYRLPIALQSGVNRILVKVCQDEQKEEWTVQWQFQLRLCDASGTPIRPSKP